MKATPLPWLARRRPAGEGGRQPPVNAFKYTPDGGEVRSVTVGAEGMAAGRRGPGGLKRGWRSRAPSPCRQHRHLIPPHERARSSTASSSAGRDTAGGAARPGAGPRADRPAGRRGRHRQRRGAGNAVHRHPAAVPRARPPTTGGADGGAVRDGGPARTASRADVEEGRRPRRARPLILVVEDHADLREFCGASCRRIIGC